MLNLLQVRKAFNRAAMTMDRADILQREVADRLMERLPMIRLQPQRILECGARTGYLSEKLADYYSNAELIVLDFTAQQLMQVTENIPCKVASHYTMLPFENNSIDMVVSSLGFNWVNDLAACFRELNRIIKPDGLLIFTLFGVDTLKELRESFISCHEYFHCFPDMHDVGDLLLQSGFENPVMDMEMLTIRYKQLTRLFQDFKFSGMGNAHQKRPKGLFGKRRWQEAITKYDTLKKDNAYPTTFEMIYGHAWRPAIDHDAATREVGVPVAGVFV